MMSMAKRWMQEIEDREWRADPEGYEERHAEERQRAEHDADLADWRQWEDEHAEPEPAE